MSADPDSKPDVPKPKTEVTAPVSEPPSRLPGWIPRWMSERERAAFIVALGIVLAAVIVAIGMWAALDNTNGW